MRTIANSSRLARTARIGIIAAAVAALAGCKGLLDVKNPGAVDASNLNSPAYINLMTAGVVGEFQQMWHWNDVYASSFAGQTTNHHVYYEEGDISRRDIQAGTLNGYPYTMNGTAQLATYQAIHRVRWLADSVASRIKNLEGDSAKRDLRLARVLAYGGYTYILLAEQICSSPINVSKMYTPEEIFAMAPPKFDEAIAVATAAKAWAAAYVPDAYWSAAALAAYQAGADSIMNFARVGAARAYLDLNQGAKAIPYAQAVTPAWTSDTNKGFAFWAYYMDTSGYYNLWWERVALAAGSGARTASLLGTPYYGVVDPRIPQQMLTQMDGYNGTVKPVPGVWTPKATQAFNNYDGTVVGAEVQRNSYLRIASAAEARYILAEAQGPTAANVDFINNRRALAAMDPLPYSVDATTYRNALIDQRERDLYLDNHALGDKRRYLKYYNLDLFLHGKFPTSSTLNYGTLTCFPVGLSELQGNPNLQGGQ